MPIPTTTPVRPDRAIMTPPTLPQRAVATAVLAFSAACASPNALLIRSNVEAEVVRLNPDQGDRQSLGTTPLRLTDLHGPYVVGLTKEGYQPETLFILEGEDVRGRISFDLTSTAKADQTASASLSQRLDKVLKAHRAFLRGQIADAKAVIAELERESGTDFALSTLKGNIALLEGRATEAKLYYDLARDILPGVSQTALDKQP